jgi:hypothetical protein
MEKRHVECTAKAYSTSDGIFTGYNKENRGVQCLKK